MGQISQYKMYALFLYTVISSTIIGTSAQDNIGTLRFATPLPSSVEVFISSTCPSVTKWMIQYRIFGNDSSTQSIETEATRIHAARVTGLVPNTYYQFRVRASQVNGVRTVAEIDYPYPSWESSDVITTDSLSIFGKVTLTNFTFTGAHRRKNSAEWIASLTTIQDVYHNAFSIAQTNTSLLRVESSTTNNPVVYYQVRVLDTSLPSNTNYAVTGPGLSDCVINNGDTAMGRVNIDITSNNGNKKYTLWYNEGSCPDGLPEAIIERYMIMSPEDSASLSIHLNVASSDATSPREEDSLIVQKNGGLIRDDGVVHARVSTGFLIGLTPRFLVKDCLRGSPTSVVYSEIFGPTLYNVGSVIEHVWDNTEYPQPFVNVTAMSCNSGLNGQSIICDIPAIRGGYKYEILNGTTEKVLGTIADTDIDCSEIIQVVARNLTSNVTYDLGLRVTVRNSDGTQQTATSATTIRVKTNEYIPSTSEPVTTVSPRITAREIETTVISATSTERSLTTADDEEMTMSPSTTDISTTTVTSPSKPMTTLRTTTEAKDNDCILAYFGCGISYSGKLWITISIIFVGSCIVIGITSFALWVRFSKRRRKYRI